MTRDEIMGMTDAELRRNVIKKSGLDNLPWDFDPATKIQDAWKLVDEGVDVTLHHHLKQRQWYCTIFIEEGKSQVYANAETAPRAICLAVLLMDNKDV